MKKINSTKKTWRLWLIKKLLYDHINKDELYSLIEDFFKEEDNYSNNISDNSEDDLMKNIIQLHDKTVEDVMVPRAEIVAVSKKDSLKKILNIFHKETHSRMPVYNEKLDDVIGMIHVKDILTQVEKEVFSINELIRDILYVAPSSPVLDLLRRMRKSKIHLGLVVDEHGGVDGLVTIEDLVEEIVGEIEDEHDADEDNEIKIKKINSQTYMADSSFTLIELQKLLNIELEMNEIDSVGGLVFYLAGKVPSIGEQFKHKSGIIFEVIDASERRINKVKITYSI